MYEAYEDCFLYVNSIPQSFENSGGKRELDRKEDYKPSPRKRKSKVGAIGYSGVFFSVCVNYVSEDGTFYFRLYG